ncbi:MAG: hypothetical protein MJ136_07445 [Clostridia bacterium]|nr:hypothetical protein [Clostridia bacterium]
MKTVRLAIVTALSAAAILLILSPSVLSGILPPAIIDAASLTEFPLLGACTHLAESLIDAIQNHQMPEVQIVLSAIGDNIVEELMALLMVAVLSIPVSMLLGTFIYKPLYKGPFLRIPLYASLNLVSVLTAWILYRQCYFQPLIQDWLKISIPDVTVQTLVSSAMQLLSAAAIGTIAIKIALSALMAKLVIGKIIFPLIGVFIRTLLFAFITALMLLLHATPMLWTTILPLLLVTLLLSGASDCAFRS